MSDKSVMQITKDNFSEIAGSNEPVLIDFWAPWCGPCRMAAPIVDQIAEETAGKVRVGKINVDDEPELAQQFGVMSIPTMVVLRGGKEAARSVGLRRKEDILDMIG
jgi:thioredoxin 1